MPEIPGVSFAQLDFLSDDAPAKLLAMTAAAPMRCCPTWRPTPPATARPTSCASWAWWKVPLRFAAEVLNPGGTFVAKVFQSGADAELVTQLKRDFASVRHVKPASSRQDSSETLRAGDGISR